MKFAHNKKLVVSVRFSIPSGFASYQVVCANTDSVLFISGHSLTPTWAPRYRQVSLQGEYQHRHTLPGHLTCNWHGTGGLYLQYLLPFIVLAFLYTSAIHCLPILPSLPSRF